MSLEITSWVIREAPPELEPSEMLLALLLADSAIVSGPTLMTVSDLAALSRTSEEHIFRGMQGLYDKKVIDWHVHSEDYISVHFMAFEEMGSLDVDEAQDSRHSAAYRKWKEAVLKRDAYSCQSCAGTEHLQAHHIKSWANFPDLRFEPSNGVTLCATCHGKLHQRAG